ncbi:MAG: hypothetical protein GWM98_29430, partial [Nitrospinaceae bacterium]|nr:hypothetical protein [Nitrospinaceae bacterium]NIR57827.1 hypothetical protein [Nitrospinaceae bacterium]NIS88290.1 hypothetical protein [Nitrospinaceae bacterium]NIT85167.1 hypothetical protein [Nitrospinaceae bacterium]NIU47321.1 hypothetical protein [Nitrospinaceae bacterium]
MTVVAGFILPVPAFAEEPVTSPISTETRVNERHVTIGDLVTYSIIVRHDPEIRVSPPVPPAQFAKGFQYVDQGTGPSRTLNGQTEDIFWFKYRADRTGFYNIPKIPVRFTSPLPDDPSQTIP